MPTQKTGDPTFFSKLGLLSVEKEMNASVKQSSRLV